MKKKKKNITKSELIYKTVKKTKGQFDQEDVKFIINNFISAICEEISNGCECIKVEGLGTFKSYTRKLHIGKNLKTGNVEEIKETKYISFKPSSKMKG